MEGDGTLYFGYGSNLDWADWKSWCEKKNLRFEGLVELSPCWLPNYSLKFHYFSNERDGGAADVVETGRGHAVPGVLFRMDDVTLKVMDRKEGTKVEAYERRKVRVILPNGTFVDALTYCVTNKSREDRFIQPTNAYSNLILQGLKKRKLPIGELKNAIENFSPSYPLEKIFVYGTLMHGELRHPTLMDSSIGEGQPASARGTILDLGDYPGMVAGDEGVIHGEVYQIDQVYPTLQTLDTIEGFYGYDSNHSLFTRTIVQIDTEYGPEWAWTYVYNKEAGMEYQTVRSGNWRDR
ncbi:MAG: gamma-glutamylcyclotransferase [Candidatus Poseidoniales archaeon]|jgi:gamma-glutamylcyclotransferase (GGCT)/AIG2-like uncharacterized protein YtfP|tara:strand:+ start:597 stop:1478 length:882 start_codon:yes stop_codon:yes gene_type:complete